MTTPNWAPTSTPEQDQAADADAALLRKAATTAATHPDLPPAWREPVADLLRLHALEASDAEPNRYALRFARTVLDTRGDDRPLALRVNDLRDALTRIAAAGSYPAADVARRALDADDNPPVKPATAEQVQHANTTLRMSLGVLEASQVEARNLAAYVYLISKATSLPEAKDLAGRALQDPGRVPPTLERATEEADNLRDQVGRAAWRIQRVRQAVAGGGDVAARVLAVLDGPDPQPERIPRSLPAPPRFPAGFAADSTAGVSL